jgi:Predicted membrane protein
VGAFVFSLSAILMFRADLYDPAASVAVFGFTVVIVVMIILAILRWIEHLSLLGSMDHTLNVVHTTAGTSLEARRTRPSLGGVPIDGAPRPPAEAVPVLARRTGYVQLVDMPRLQARLAECYGQIWLARVPGDHFLKDTPLAFALLPEDGDPASYAGYFTIGSERTFEQDARYGLTVLSEIGQRAKSPGVNNPGTAIEALARIEGLLWQFGRPRDGAMPATRFDRVHVPDITAYQLFNPAFAPMERDSASCI